MNNKGSFKNGGSVGKRILGFFKESGFYIAIVVGLCALAAGAVFFSTNQILTDPDQNAKENNQIDSNQGDQFGLIDDTQNLPEDITSDQSSINDSIGADIPDGVPDSGQTVIDNNNPADADTVGQEAQTDQSANTEASGDQASTDKSASQDGDTAQTSGNAGIEDDTAPAEDVVLAVVKPNFDQPVKGKVQAAYSMDKLVFSPTFNEWRTHSGVDISAPRGEVVHSIGNGVVLEVKNDPRYGFTIVIDHKNGYKSLYANLASDKTMTVGKEVKIGDAIGSVGATAIFESAEATHIHFELFKENKLVDPAAYIDFLK